MTQKQTAAALTWAEFSHAAMARAKKSRAGTIAAERANVRQEPGLQLFTAPGGTGAQQPLKSPAWRHGHG